MERESGDAAFLYRLWKREKALSRKTRILVLVSIVSAAFLAIFYQNRVFLRIWGLRRGVPLVLAYKFPIVAPLLFPGIQNPSDYAWGVYVATFYGGDPELNRFLRVGHTYGFGVYERVGRMVAGGMDLCTALTRAGITQSRDLDKALQGFTLGMQALGLVFQVIGGDIVGAVMTAGFIASQIPDAVRQFQFRC